MSHLAIYVLLVALSGCLAVDAAACNLPNHWAGQWYQGKDLDLLSINRTSFLNRGSCVEHRQDKFIFYEAKEDCYRCVFIMLKHANVMQYRASYCTEQSDFYANCQNLTPESELITLYRESAQSETCPLGGLYVMTQELGRTDQQDDDRSYRSSGGGTKCSSDPSQRSMLMECSDHSMLKLQFDKCTNMPTFIVHCMAHWTEGNINYLIGRVSTHDESSETVTSSQRTRYRCLAYTDSLQENAVNPDIRRHARRDEATASSSSSKDLIQMSISHDEFCRNVDNVIDDQLSYSFSRVLDSKTHVAPPSVSAASPNGEDNRIFRQLSANISSTTSTVSSSAEAASQRQQQQHRSSCKFPRWLNKRWHNLKQSKLFTIDYRMQSLFVTDEKNAIVINKYTCAHMRAKTRHQVQAIVKSLNGCSSGYQCLTITSKSDFVLEIKFGKISYEGSAAINCNDGHISQEFVYVDTNYGVECPLKSGIYEKLDAKTSAYRSARLQAAEQPAQQQQQPCKYLTQTQTLQIGCQSEQEYSFRTKLCYPNQPATANTESVDDAAAASKLATTAYTQLESEINLVVLAHWRHDGHYVIVSRTMSNEILCSIWASSDGGNFLQLLEIDSNCNYDKSSYQRINYGFMYVNRCNAVPSAAVGGSSSLSASSASSRSSSLPPSLNSMSLIAVYLVLTSLLCVSTSS